MLVRLVVGGSLPWTILLLPLVSLPLLFLSLGVAWFLAGLGVYVRDIGQAAALALQVLMFATPIFYPPSLIPEGLRALLLLNPLADVVENWRRVVLWGRLPEWGRLGLWTLVGALVLMLGYAWFTNTKRGFADVL
jgi:lipopolysaccharide transport system permease protein